MFLLDANVISELRRPVLANPGVLVWVAATPTTSLFLSVMTVQELEHGVLLIERRDPKAGAILRDWFENQVLLAFEDRILDVNTQVARVAASFHVPNPAPFADALIAATALANSMTVVTRNETDFKQLEVRIINPWNTPD